MVARRPSQSGYFTITLSTKSSIKFITLESCISIPEGWAQEFRTPSFSSRILRTSFEMILADRVTSINMLSGMSVKSSFVEINLLEYRSARLPSAELNSGVL